MRRARVAFVALVAFLASTATGSAVEVPVRGWSHPKFGRIVFDWPIAVTYSATISDQRLAVRFGSSISARFASALRNLGSFVRRAEISKDGRVVRFRLAGTFNLRSFRNDNAIVIDLLKGADQSNRSLPALNVRVGEHPAYTRLVFDWRSAVTYSATLEDGNLSVRFDRAARIDLDKLRRELPPLVVNPGVDGDLGGMAFSLTVPAGSRLRHFRSGTKIVIDVLAKRADVARADSTPVRPVAAKTAPVAPESISERAEQDEPAPEKTPARLSGGGPPRRLLSKTKADPPAGPAPPPEIPATTDSPDARAAERSAETEAADSTSAKADVAKAFENAKPETVSGKAGEVLVSLVFEWPEPVGAAVFERAGFVWVVFDQRAPLDLVSLRAAGKGLISRLEQLPIGQLTVLRMVPRKDLAPFARRDGTNWVVDFERGRIRPGIQIPIEAKTLGDDGPTLFFPAIEVGDILRIPDPEVGDMIKVATLKASGQGIAGQRAYPEFQILASTQGIAIVAFNSELELKKNENGLTLSVSGGLHISGISPDNDRAGVSTSSGRTRRIFRMSEWPLGARERLFEYRQKLQESAARQPTAKRNAARLKLAKFYFARGMAPEARGVMQVIEGEDERLAIQPDFKALKGAIALLNNDVEEAARNLNDPRLDKFDEIRLWRGLVAAARLRWKEASLFFKQGEAVLHGYPEPIRSRLALVRIEAALKARDTDAAGRWLNILSKNSDEMTRGEKTTMRYLQGRIAFVKRDLDRATKLWRGLLNSNDNWNAARADLSLVNLGLLQETMTVDEAVARLESLRYRWRGDEFELQVLRRLGGLYLARDQYRKGLNAYRVIATYFLNHPDTKRIAQLMTATFKKLYLEGGADNLSPLTALALFDEFRELTPPGPDGNRMIQKLAERLVDVDLLNRAAELLLHQVKFRLKGEDRAVVGAKLALIQLLDQNPTGAIKALRMTAYSRLPEELDDDRRRIQARAYFETGRPEEAIELLAGDVSRNADLLRADINWRTENWAEAAKSLQRMAGQPPAEGTTFDREESQIILNWAVAMRLNKDESGLAVLRELYGPAMIASPLGNAFQFIASASNPDEPLDLEKVTSRIAETDVFDAFLAEYLEDNRKRLLKPPAKTPSTGTTPQAAAPEAPRPASG